MVAYKTFELVKAQKAAKYAPKDRHGYLGEDTLSSIVHLRGHIFSFPPLNVGLFLCWPERSQDRNLR